MYLSVVKYKLVIFVKVSYSKGLHTAGLLSFTLQLLVLLFEYIVDVFSIPAYIFENWAGIAGYVILSVLFLKKEKVTTDLILIVIGILLWGVQTFQSFGKFPDQFLTDFVFSAAGILGMVLSTVALLFDVKADCEKRDGK